MISEVKNGVGGKESKGWICSTYTDRIYYNRGSAYCKLGLTRQAVDDYSKAIEIRPDVVSRYYNRSPDFLGKDNIPMLWRISI